MTKVEEALVEIDAALAVIGPEREGLRDYQRLNIKPETKVQVDAALVTYDQRYTALTAAKDKLQLLLADGYPDISIQPVSAAVITDLEENQQTITAALAKFSEIEEAVTIGITPGTPQQQP